MFFYYLVLLKNSHRKITSLIFYNNYTNCGSFYQKQKKNSCQYIYAIISCYQLAELIKHYIMIENINNEQSSSSRHITLDSARTKLRTPMGFLHGLTHKVGVFDPPSVFDANA